MSTNPANNSLARPSRKAIVLMPTAAGVPVIRAAFPPTARVCMPRWNGTAGFTSGTCGGFATVCGNWGWTRGGPRFPRGNRMTMPRRRSWKWNLSLLRHDDAAINLECGGRAPVPRSPPFKTAGVTEDAWRLGKRRQAFAFQRHAAGESGNKFPHSIGPLPRAPGAGFGNRLHVACPCVARVRAPKIARPASANGKCRPRGEGRTTEQFQRTVRHGSASAVGILAAENQQSLAGLGNRAGAGEVSRKPQGADRVGRGDRGIGHAHGRGGLPSSDDRAAGIRDDCRNGLGTDDRAAIEIDGPRPRTPIPWPRS